MMRTFLTIIFFLTFLLQTSAQETDMIAHSNKKNTIRWNVTPMFVVGPKSIVLGYERIISPNQSISINIGYLEKKPFTNKDGEIIQLFDETSKSGFDISLDYRFYFKERNKRLAPDGIYWGPYISYYNLSFNGKSNIIENNIVTNIVGINTDINIYSLGLQLGYQFVLKEKFTLDLILIGPSFTRYDIAMKFDAQYELDKDSEFYKNAQEILEKFIPGGSILLNGQTLTSSGRIKFNYVGFRYLVQIGYRF